MHFTGHHPSRDSRYLRRGRVRTSGTPSGFPDDHACGVAFDEKQSFQHVPLAIAPSTSMSTNLAALLSRHSLSGANEVPYGWRHAPLSQE